MPAFSEKSAPKLREKTWGINGALLLSDSVIRNGAIVIHENKILAIGDSAALTKKYKNIPFFDASNYIVSAGLINSHTHAPMGLFRDLAHGKQQMIERFFFPLEKNLTPELIEPLSYSYLVEGLKSGTTCFFDHYYFSDGVAAAIERLGMRGVVGETMADLSGAFPDKEILKKVKKQLASWKWSSRITPCLAPHASDTVSEKLLKEIVALSRKENLPLHFHLAQTANEAKTVKKRYGKSAIQFAKNIGLLGESSLAVHLVCVNDADWKIVCDSGATVGFCPSSQILYEKLAPIEKMLAAKIPVALGTDCAASNDGANIRSELKIAALLYTDRTHKPAAEKDFLAMVTKNPGRVLGKNRFGSIATGQLADLVFWKKHIGLSPIHKPLANFIYSASSDRAEHVLVDGRWVLWNGSLVMATESKLLEVYQVALRAIYKRLPKSMGRKLLDSMHY